MEPGSDQALPRATSWTAAIIAASLPLGALVAFYWSSIVELVSLWSRTEAYGHAYLVLPISGYLVWVQRGRLRLARPRPSGFGAPWLLTAVGVWVAGSLVDVQAARQLAPVLILSGIVLLVLGTRIARILAFPIGYLLLVTSVWSALVPTLQGYTAVAVARSLQMLGVPIYLEGYFLTIPNGQFVVADVCSGLRYLLAGMAIAALYAHLNLRSASRAVAIFAAGVAIAIVFNWLRVDVIVMVGYLRGMDHPLIAGHATFGWFTFAAGLLPLFVFGRWLERREDALGLAAAEPAARPGPSTPPEPRAAALPLACVMALSLLAGGPALLVWLSGATADSHHPVTLEPIEGRGAWTAVGDADDATGISFPGADAELRAAYMSAYGRVSLYVPYFRYQAQGREVVSENNRLYGPGKGQVGGVALRTVTPEGSGSVQFREVMITHRGRSRVIWVAYLLNGRIAATPHGAKLLQLWAVLQRSPAAAAVIASTDTDADAEAARDRLRDFFETLLPEVRRAVSNAQSG